MPRPFNAGLFKPATVRMGFKPNILMSSPLKPVSLFPNIRKEVNTFISRNNFATHSKPTPNLDFKKLCYYFDLLVQNISPIINSNISFPKRIGLLEEKLGALAIIYNTFTNNDLALEKRVLMKSMINHVKKFIEEGVKRIQKNNNPSDLLSYSELEPCIKEIEKHISVIEMKISQEESPITELSDSPSPVPSYTPGC